MSESSVRGSGLRRVATAGLAALALVFGGAVGVSAAAADDDPVNVALASGDNAPETDVSYVAGWNSAAALNDGDNAATDDYGKMWGTWGDPENPAQDVATYTWETPVTVESTKLFLWQNHLTGDSGVMLPSAWKVEYLDADGEWAQVTGADTDFPVPELDEENPVSSLPAVESTFDPVTTTSLRLVLDCVGADGERKATSVIEWEAWGATEPGEEPPPEDQDGFIDAEQVAVRTATGATPELPEQAWVTDENGPLHYVDVDWADIDEALYVEPGTFEVEGAPAGYEGQTVTATVHVADELSDAIERVDYVSTITTPGVEPGLPKTVRAVYDDGTASSGLPVEWDAIEPAQYAQADAVFDVPGAVDGYAPDATATVFVVEPVEQTAPIIAIEFDSAPPGSGWYTQAPTATITAEPTGSPVQSVEYSLDGETWNAYEKPFAVDAQGEIALSVRATSEDGSVGEASEELKIDTQLPETAVDYEVDGDTALVTLTPSDPEPGSGVTRTVWSDGPDSSPTGGANNMFATYEKPFSVQLTKEPRYVHVQTQDAAGNLEEYVTVELPQAGEGGDEDSDSDDSSDTSGGSEGDADSGGADGGQDSNASGGADASADADDDADGGTGSGGATDAGASGSADTGGAGSSDADSDSVDGGASGEDDGGLVDTGASPIGAIALFALLSAVAGTLLIRRPRKESV